jgi:hypothetical protein
MTVPDTLHLKGLTIPVKPHWPTASVLWLTVTLGTLVVMGTGDQPVLVVLALLPLAWALVTWKRFVPARQAEVTAEGFRFDAITPLIRFGAIRRIQFNALQPLPDALPAEAGSVRIVHDTGEFSPQTSRQLTAGGVYRAILAELPADGEEPKDGLLYAHLQDCRAAAESRGDEHPVSYAAWQPPRAVRGGLFLVSTLVVAGVWMGVSAVSPRDVAEVLQFCGVMAAIVGVLGTLYLTGAKRVPGGIKQPETVGIVISAEGFALVQGELRGVAKWSEIRDVRYVPRHRFGLVPRPVPRVEIKLPGVIVDVYDLFDRPLPLVFEQLEEHRQLYAGTVAGTAAGVSS